MTWVRKKLKVSWVEENEEERKARLEGNLKAYEASYGKSSQEMLEQVSNFEMEETEDVFDWLCDYQDLRMMEKVEKMPLDSEGNVIIPEMTDAEVAECISGLKLDIKNYEKLHGMTTSEMLNRLDKEEIEETVEILDWRLAFRDLADIERVTRTNGKPLTATAQSTTSN